jgi:hypothetical protein
MQALLTIDIRVAVIVAYPSLECGGELYVPSALTREYLCGNDGWNTYTNEGAITEKEDWFWESYSGQNEGIRYR